MAAAERPLSLVANWYYRPNTAVGAEPPGIVNR
jgi:hypothetical protein